MFDGLFRFFWNALYGLTKFIAWIVGLLYNCFEIAIGLDTVTYEGDSSKTLLEIVFGHSYISRAFWTMAIIGIALCFFFTILSVIRKMFDSSDEVKASLGQILTQSFKSILIILCMSLVMKMTLYFSSTLMKSIQLAFFSNTSVATQTEPKTYTKTEYATMARVLNTIGNYSLNSSYNSRYNINSCYNAIRADLESLNSQGTFSVRYETPDVLNKKEHYWQEALQKIVLAAPTLTSDIPLDEYNATLTEAITNVMEELKNDKSFQPLEKYASSIQGANSEDIALDRILLLVGTLDAANDSDYNGNKASITDIVRAPYYYADKGHDVYSNDDMWKSFDLSDFSYVTIIFMAIMIIYNMAEILLTAIARIFNMAVLYIVSPPLIAMSPLDNGSKFKQWRTSFMVQAFSVFGTLIAIDVVITFIPIIMSSDLVIFNNVVTNYMAKLVICWGAFAAAKKAGNLVSGILAENASMTAADSLKMGDAAGAMTGAVLGTAGYVSGAKAISGIAGMTWDNAKATIQSKLPWGNRGNNSGSSGSGKGSGSSFVKTSGGGTDKGAGGGSTASSTGGEAGGTDGTGGGTNNQNPSKSSDGDKDKGPGGPDDNPSGGPGGTAGGGNNAPGGTTNDNINNQSNTGTKDQTGTTNEKKNSSAEKVARTTPPVPLPAPQKSMQSSKQSNGGTSTSGTGTGQTTTAPINKVGGESKDVATSTDDNGPSISAGTSTAPIGNGGVETQDAGTSTSDINKQFGEGTYDTGLADQSGFDTSNFNTGVEYTDASGYINPMDSNVNMMYNDYDNYSNQNNHAMDADTNQASTNMATDTGYSVQTDPAVNPAVNQGFNNVASTPPPNVSYGATANTSATNNISNGNTASNNNAASGYQFNNVGSSNLTNLNNK